MPETPQSILFKYWKHLQFRPLQEEIINSVLQRHDTLALLPTGGGKSVCFQVPALLMEGICIVVSPLIALMKDQVENLRKRGIPAVAIHSGMDRSEIDRLLDNCIHGHFKFLYVSPERLQSGLFIARVRQMKVALLAVDEAHCISQWGYDFRPPYLQLADLRDIHPETTVIALTATATPRVKEDIIDKLKFRTGCEVHQRTFARDNISFVVRETERKEKKLLEILRKVKGCAIVYVRSRKKTVDLAEWLLQHQISAAVYHAGLKHHERAEQQEAWLMGQRRVMVATNAFGMGIDKGDVRLVVHMDLPENLESYYQEAGRAGRDGKRSYAVILYHKSDVLSLQAKVNQNHPDIEYLKHIYQCLANYYQLAVGSAEGESFIFDLHDFCDRFNMQLSEVYVALKKLEEEGLIQFNESYYSPSRLMFLADRSALYEFQVAHERFDPLIKMLLRLYGAQLFTEFIPISELQLAKGMTITEPELKQQLNHLTNLQVLNYFPVADGPQVTFIMSRQDAAYLPVNRQRLAERKQLALDNMNAMITYTEEQHRCRMQIILDYFGEQSWQMCGLCDVCISQRKKDNATESRELHEEIIRFLSVRPMTSEELEEHINPKDLELLIEVIRELVDEGTLEYDDVWNLRLTGRIPSRS